MASASGDAIFHEAISQVEFAAADPHVRTRDALKSFVKFIITVDDVLFKSRFVLHLKLRFADAFQVMCVLAFFR